MKTKKTSEKSRDKYIVSMKRIFTSIDQRCALTDEVPSLGMVPAQIAIRSMLLAKSTINGEIAATRFILNEVVDVETWDHIHDLPDWVAYASYEEARKVIESGKINLKWLKENALAEA